MKQLGAAIYCTVVTVGFVAQCLMLYLQEIPPSQRDFALFLMGALVASFKDVGNYFTGSTASSQAKDATIAQMATTPTATMTTTATSPAGASTVTTTGIPSEVKT